MGQRIFECVLSIGTRSAQSIMASDHIGHKQAAHMTAPDQWLQMRQKVLVKGTWESDLRPYLHHQPKPGQCRASESAGSGTAPRADAKLPSCGHRPPVRGQTHSWASYDGERGQFGHNR
jgi:hypothetical protein